MLHIHENVQKNDLENSRIFNFYRALKIFNNKENLS